jgi:hypothetical protein
MSSVPRGWRGRRGIYIIFIEDRDYPLTTPGTLFTQGRYLGKVYIIGILRKTMYKRPGKERRL